MPRIDPNPYFEAVTYNRPYNTFPKVKTFWEWMNLNRPQGGYIDPYNYNNLFTAGNPPVSSPVMQTPTPGITPTNASTPAVTNASTPTNLFGGLSAPGLSTNAQLNPLAGYWNQMYGGEELQPNGAPSGQPGQPENQPGDMWWNGEMTADGPNLNRGWWGQLGRNYGLNWGTQYGPNPWGGSGNWQQPTKNKDGTYNDTMNRWGQPVGTPGPYGQRGGKSGKHGYGSPILNPETYDWASVAAKEQAALDKAIAGGADPDYIARLQGRLAKWNENLAKYGGGGQPTGGYQTYTPRWYNNLTAWKSKG